MCRQEEDRIRRWRIKKGGGGGEGRGRGRGGRKREGRRRVA